MKPTLNEEIGMSQQGIDYVNSLEVKEPRFEIPEYTKGYVNENNDFLITDTPLKTIEVGMKAIKNDLHMQIDKYNEQQRIRKQARNALICVFVIILLTVILNWKS